MTIVDALIAKMPAGEYPIWRNSEVEQIIVLARELERHAEAQHEALELIAEQCEGHPAYIPDATDEDMHREGGDAACITYWAQTARTVLAPYEAFRKERS